LDVQVLLSLPCITREDLLAFEDALLKTSSPKEQKQHMRSLLQLATGNKLKALAAQKSTNVITNVTGDYSSVFFYSWILHRLCLLMLFQVFLILHTVFYGTVVLSIDLISAPNCCSQHRDPKENIMLYV